MFAEAAAGTFAGKARYVNFKARFGKGKVGRTIARFCVRTEKFGEKLIHGREEVGKGYVTVDVKTFDLVEEDMRAGRDIFIAETTARRDDA